MTENILGFGITVDNIEYYLYEKHYELGNNGVEASCIIFLVTENIFQYRALVAGPSYQVPTPPQVSIMPNQSSEG